MLSQTKPRAALTPSALSAFASAFRSAISIRSRGGKA